MNIPFNLFTLTLKYVTFTLLPILSIVGIRLTLRGKAHTEWKVNKAGERRTVKDEEYYIDDKKVLWGKGNQKYFV